MARPAPLRRATDEAHGDPASLQLEAATPRATRELAYGQQRLLEIALALATRPRVLLLDEPAAGVPKDESAELFAAIAGLSRELTVLFIEHDMDVVFRFASRIIVMVGGRILVEGTPARDRARPARARGLPGKAGHRCLSCATCAPATATPWCSTASRSTLPADGSLAVLGRNGVGKSTLLLTIMGFTRLHRGAIPGSGEDISRAAAAPRARSSASAGWRRSARSFPRSPSRRT